MSNRDQSTFGGPRPGRQRLGSRAATDTRKPANPLTSPCRQADSIGLPNKLRSMTSEKVIVMSMKRALAASHVGRTAI